MMRLVAARSLRRCRSSSGSSQQPRVLLVSPPDQRSNLVLLKWPAPQSAHEEALVALYKEVHSFNHTFWAHHNEEFKQRKAHFIDMVHSQRCEGPSHSKLTTSELSEFYRRFLNDKYHSHIAYLRKWAWLNWKLTYTILLVRLKNSMSVFYKTR